MNMMHRFLATTEVVNDNCVKAIAASSKLARDGHIIDMRGLDTSAFQRAGVILWNHDVGAPVGVPTSCGLDASGLLRIEVEFAPIGASPKADEIRNLVKAGIVRSLSIGFQPIEVEPLDPRKPRGGLRIKRSELLEVSFCSIPIDTTATVTARAGATCELDGGDFERRKRDLRALELQGFELAAPHLSHDHAHRMRQVELLELQARTCADASSPPSHAERLREVDALRR